MITSLHFPPSFYRLLLLSNLTVLYLEVTNSSSHQFSKIQLTADFLSISLYLFLSLPPTLCLPLSLSFSSTHSTSLCNSASLHDLSLILLQPHRCFPRSIQRLHFNSAPCRLLPSLRLKRIILHTTTTHATARTTEAAAAIYTRTS